MRTFVLRHLPDGKRKFVEVKGHEQQVLKGQQKFVNNWSKGRVEENLTSEPIRIEGRSHYMNLLKQGNWVPAGSCDDPRRTMKRRSVKGEAKKMAGLISWEKVEGVR